MTRFFKNKNKIGELRPNQMITTFGPGAIVDAVKDSVTVLDTRYWGKKGKKIIDQRLASYLGVDCFYVPHTASEVDKGDEGGIPVISFPYMHICPKCGRIFNVNDHFKLDRYLQYGATCPDCNLPAYPSRFIVMCENGHIDDFPWDWWVHGGKTGCNGILKMYSTGRTSNLADIMVRCTCGAKRNMGGATLKENLEGLHCRGHHPFRPGEKDRKCDKPLIPSQKGASNVYFPVSRSAISIPPWTDPLYELISAKQEIIREFYEEFGDEGLTRAFNRHFKGKYEREEFDEALKRMKKGVKEFREIKQMEHKAITHHMDPQYTLNKVHFKTEKEETLPPYFKQYFEKIIRITRLREVKVLLGFTRVDASDPEAEEQPNIVYLDKGKDEKWLPAVEINGEGIFIEFNKDTLARWLSNNGVKAISKKYADSYKKFCEEKGWENAGTKDACYVLLHTFAHLLIKQMSMFSGYSSSAIRERIYFGERMAGVLFYTGSSDKEGSLGGLVELGTISKLRTLMKDMFQEALFCTNDPECLYNMPAGSNSNGAACHSCCMISETACENGNRMLDRGLVVPIENREDQAYFKELVIELCQLEMQI